MMILLIVVRCVEQSGEELERRLALAEKADCEYIGKHIITTEQIRAAVEVALTLERGISEHVPDEMKKIFERAAAAVWNALGKRKTRHRAV
jgi:hypothetical protein